MLRTNLASAVVACARAAAIPIAGSAAIAAAGMASTPPPPPPPPPYNACVAFPHSVIGTTAYADMPTMLPGAWISEPLRKEDLTAIVDVLEKLPSGFPESPDRDHSALGDLVAATIANLRSGLPPAELARRQRASYRIYLARGKTGLLAPGRILDDRTWVAVSMTTWLLSFKAARQAPAEEAFTDQLEPLTEIVGMSLADAVNHFTYPAFVADSFAQPKLHFAHVTLQRPRGGTLHERRVVRALALTLDNARETPAAGSRLFVELDEVVRNYLARQRDPIPVDDGVAREAIVSSRPLDETRRLLSTALFQEMRSGRRPSLEASEPDREKSFCA